MKGVKTGLAEVTVTNGKEQEQFLVGCTGKDTEETVRKHVEKFLPAAIIVDVKFVWE